MDNIAQQSEEPGILPDWLGANDVG
jgi:hypothetical protein